MFQIIIEEVVTEETLSSVGDVVEDLNLLTDEQLAARLRQHGVDVGPIVGKKILNLPRTREHSVMM